MIRADDPWWRRPAGSTPEPVRSEPWPPTGAVPDYQGPPPNNPPPAQWRPHMVDTPPPPRQLPEQNHERIDVEEQAAQTLTKGIGLVAGAIALVILLILCARGLF